MTIVKKKLFLILVETIRQNLFRTIKVGRGTSVMGLCCKGERLGSTLKTTRQSENL